MAIKAIIFDCFGVLVIPGKAALLQDYPQLTSEIHDLQIQSDYGYISRYEYNQSISILTGLSVSEFAKKYWSANVRNEAAINLAHQLHGAGQYKIGLLSNIGREWLGDVLPTTERAGLFDGEVLSGEVGMIKPACEIYELTAVRLGVLPSECIMIDDIRENIDGAELAGMAGIIFVSLDQLKSDLSTLLEQDNARTT